MPILTLIARSNDGLLLSGSVEDDKYSISDVQEYEKKAKKIIENTKKSQDIRLHIEDPPFYFVYIKENGVVYLTLCPEKFPRKIAFCFLEELLNEFTTIYSLQQINSTSVPYHFNKFENFILKTKKVYTDSRSQHSLSQVSEELKQVHSIFSQSINEILNRQKNLTKATEKSSSLLEESKKYEKAANDLKRQMLFRKYAPLAAILVIIILFLFFYFFYW
eukprot:TRINITY_DN478_c0_g1_i1.p1 TRINITY_DN478_c0_g1~~TRINITY_DN478_c0_g1_i1.p1  ORF type:complete len:219 (-),score=48.82 TRINITY_DN478_c0_g1_i1:316-972(-)